MHRTNTPDNVRSSGYINVDAGEGVTTKVPGPSVQTGLRKITELNTDRTAGDIYVQRDGNMVFIQVTGLKTSTMGTGTNFSAVTLPVGFRPPLNTWDPTPLHVSESEPQYVGDVLTVQRTNIGTSGLMRFFGADPNLPVYYSGTFMTADPAPATLPGVAA